MDACCVRRSSAGRKRGSVRRSRVVLAPRPWRYVGSNAGNGGKKGRFPGESAYKPSNHCAGKAGMSRLYLSNPCAFFLHFSTRCCGRSRRPAFPAPLCPENLAECANGRLRTNRPLLELSPLRPKAIRACNRARDSSGVFLNPNSCKGFEPEPSKEGSG